MKPQTQQQTMVPNNMKQMDPCQTTTLMMGNDSRAVNLNEGGDTMLLQQSRDSTDTSTASSSSSADDEEGRRSSDDVDTKYCIDYSSEELGRGHKTIVRKCIERKTGKRFAIKSTKKENTNLVKHMRREAALLRRVGEHPSIIRVHDVYEDDNHFHVVMELCRGGDLFDRVMDKAQSPEEHVAERDAASIVRQIVKAVAYCHSKNIVHRDIKLENVVFASKSSSEKYRCQDANEIRLIDFGLAVEHNAETDAPLTGRSGTTDYVAPEVLNKSYSNSCDLWSIGVLTYSLLSARPPFAGDNAEETLELIQSHDVEFPSRDWEDFTETSKDFIRSLLQKDPSLRPTAAELLNHAWLQQVKQVTHQQLPMTNKSKQSSQLRPMQRFKKALHFRPKRKVHCH